VSGFSFLILSHQMEEISPRISIGVLVCLVPLTACLRQLPPTNTKAKTPPCSLQLGHRLNPMLKGRLKCASPKANKLKLRLMVWTVLRRFLLAPFSNVLVCDKFIFNYHFFKNLYSSELKRLMFIVLQTNLNQILCHFCIYRQLFGANKTPASLQNSELA
jgi:hypothetical protein